LGSPLKRASPVSVVEQENRRKERVENDQEQQRHKRLQRAVPRSPAVSSLLSTLCRLAVHTDKARFSSRAGGGRPGRPREEKGERRKESRHSKAATAAACGLLSTFDSLPWPFDASGRQPVRPQRGIRA
jgi:hypothetical protein